MRTQHRPAPKRSDAQARKLSQAESESAWREGEDASVSSGASVSPSRELVPCTGHAPDGETPLWSRLAVIGPLARSADDLGLALAVLAVQSPAAPRPGAGIVGV